jgi:hypothetical protein
LQPIRWPKYRRPTLEGRVAELTARPARGLS